MAAATVSKLGQFPTRTGQRGKVCQQHQNAKHYKTKTPSTQGRRNCQLGLRAEGVKHLCVKKNRRKSVSILNIATYNVRTQLRDEQIQEHEDKRRETRLAWDVTVIGEVRRRQECFTTLQSGHLLCYSKANNGQAGVTVLIKRKWKECKEHQPQNSSVYNKALQTEDSAPTTSYSEEYINSFYNDVDETRETNPLHDSDGRLQCSNREKNKY